MEKNKIDMRWKKDFQVFMAITPAKIPPMLNEKVLLRLENELNPSAFKVFKKVIFIHFFMSLLTLFFCPQFGFSISSHFDLATYFMKFGHTVCMLGCGAVFTGLSFSAVTVFLKPEEIRFIRGHRALYLLSLSGLSLGAFICLGADVIFNLGLVWLIGATFGGYLTLEWGWKTRKFLI